MKRFGRYRGLVSLALLLVAVPLLTGLPALRQSVSLALECHEQQRRLDELVRDSLRRESGTSVPDSALALCGNGLPADTLFALVVRGGCTVGKYTPLPVSVQGGLVLHTSEITLCGGYVPLVRIVDYIERRMPSCKILSAVFKTVPKRESSPGKELRITLRIACLTNQTP